jgi:hypothetical protein
VTDAEVAALAAQLRQSIEDARRVGGQSRILREERLAMRRRLAEEFGRRIGWTWRHAPYAAQHLVGMRKRPCWQWDEPPHMDHGSGYRVGRRPAAIVSQPYNTSAEAEAEMCEWAEQRCLVFWRPDFPSWWYPGWTRLYVFAAPEMLAHRGEAP